MTITDPEPFPHAFERWGRYVDVLFELPDGRQVCMTIMHDGRYRYMERPNKDASWGPPCEGTVVK